jgi:predicted Zn-ribbon and HTH transcriptional regulator
MTTDTPDRYHTSQTATCETCGWQWRQTLHPTRNVHEPVECPKCDFEARRAALDAVLAKNTDLKGKDNGTP